MLATVFALWALLSRSNTVLMGIGETVPKGTLLLGVGKKSPLLCFAEEKGLFFFDEEIISMSLSKCEFSVSYGNDLHKINFDFMRFK